MSENLITYYLDLHKKYIKLYGNKSLVLLQNGKFYETYSITEDETLEGKLIGPDCKHLEDLTNVSMFRKGKEKKQEKVVDRHCGCCCSHINWRLLCSASLSLFTTISR